MSEKVFIKSSTQLIELSKVEDAIAEHNNFPSLQGGTSGEYYHLTSAELDSVQNEFVNWAGVWLQREYKPNTMTKDGSWTMISNKITSDRPAPQNVGGKQYGIAEGTVMSTASNTSIVRVEHKFTFDKGQAGFLENVSVMAPQWNLDSVSQVTITDETTGASRVINNPILTPGEWTSMSVGSFLIPEGTVINVEFSYYNSTASDGIDGDWTAAITTGAAANESINLDSGTVPTVISISYTDLDGTDRETELTSVVIGSIITVYEQADTSRYVTVEVSGTPVESATSIEYPVESRDFGSAVRSGKDCTVNIDLPISQPSQYAINAGYYTANEPDFASMRTALYFGDALQPDATDAYGINIQFQQATLSPDWELVAISATSASTSGTSALAERVEKLELAIEALTP